jgi:hypothetical protein
MVPRRPDDARSPTMTTTTTIAVPTSCAALCTQLAELTQRIDDELAQAGNGAAIDYGALEQRVADALGEVECGLHAGVAAPLRALMAEVDREAHVHSATPPDFGCPERGRAWL